MSEPTTDEEIRLKWGTLKGWSFNEDNAPALDLLKRYHEIGASMSAAMQEDTPVQKQVLCDLIRQHRGTIYLDWDGKYITKDEAVAYIMNYGKRAA